MIELDDVEPLAAQRRAVRVRTDHSRHPGTPGCAEGRPHLTGAAAEHLVAAGAACAGIDSLDIDATAGTGERPVHTTLPRHDIAVVEHLTDPDAIRADAFRFTAVGPRSPLPAPPRTAPSRRSADPRLVVLGRPTDRSRSGVGWAPWSAPAVT